MSEKTLLLLSGGADSETLAYWLNKQGYFVEYLYFDFEQGQTNNERESAVSIAKQLGAYLTILKSPRPRDLLRNIISSNDDEVELFGDVTHMCTTAATFAFISGVHSISLGLNADDVRRHPGLQNQFFVNIEGLVSLWMGNRFKVLTPFLDKDKSTVIRIGIELGVPFESSWSCNTNVNIHCGMCSDCLARRQAFREVGFVDPTRYEREI